MFYNIFNKINYLELLKHCTTTYYTLKKHIEKTLLDYIKIHFQQPFCKI